MGDVIVADVVDEDGMKTSQRRAGMYIGMSSLVIPLSGALVIGSALAVTTLTFYPLQGAKLEEVRRFLSARSGGTEVESV
jgi:Na+/melibiose symporter-like transporter